MVLVAAAAAAVEGSLVAGWCPMLTTATDAMAATKMSVHKSHRLRFGKSRLLVALCAMKPLSGSVSSTPRVLSMG